MRRKLRLTAFLLCCLHAAAAFAQAEPPAPLVVGTTASGVAVARAGTPVHLMVVNEVTTKTAKVGDRFLLRVDRAVEVDGRVLVPAGASAWGEVASAEKNGVIGKPGKLAARLLYIEAPTGKIALRGEPDASGSAGTTSNVLGFVTLGYAGPLALLAPGNNAKLKAGEVLIGYLADELSAP